MKTTPNLSMKHSTIKKEEFTTRSVHDSVFSLLVEKSKHALKTSDAAQSSITHLFEPSDSYSRGKIPQEGFVRTRKTKDLGEKQRQPRKEKSKCNKSKALSKERRRANESALPADDGGLLEEEAPQKRISSYDDDHKTRTTGGASAPYAGVSKSLSALDDILDNRRSNEKCMAASYHEVSVRRRQHKLKDSNPRMSDSSMTNNGSSSTRPKTRESLQRKKSKRLLKKLSTVSRLSNRNLMAAENMDDEVLPTTPPTRQSGGNPYKGLGAWGDDPEDLFGY